MAMKRMAVAWHKEGKAQFLSHSQTAAAERGARAGAQPTAIDPLTLFILATCAPTN